MAIPVHISADSTVDLSPELVERFGITVLPMLVTLDGDTTIYRMEETALAQVLTLAALGLS